MYSVNQVLGLLTHRPIGWVNFPRKSRVSFNYKSTQSPAWMPDILIRGDGYETKFYKKD